MLCATSLVACNFNWVIHSCSDHYCCTHTCQWPHTHECHFFWKYLLSRTRATTVTKTSFLAGTPRRWVSFFTAGQHPQCNKPMYKRAAQRWCAFYCIGQYSRQVAILQYVADKNKKSRALNLAEPRYCAIISSWIFSAIRRTSLDTRILNNVRIWCTVSDIGRTYAGQRWIHNELNTSDSEPSIIHNESHTLVWPKTAIGRVLEITRGDLSAGPRSNIRKWSGGLPEEVHRRQVFCEFVDFTTVRCFYPQPTLSGRS